MRSSVILGFLLVGCVGDLVPPPAPAVHWFSLDRTRVVQSVSARPGTVSVHLESVEAARHLSDRLVRRISDVEFTVHEDTHWVEAPVRVLERGLRRALFEERGLVSDFSAICRWADDPGGLYAYRRVLFQFDHGMHAGFGVGNSRSDIENEKSA